MIALVYVVLTCGRLYAQGDYRAAITGVIRDSSQAAVPGATVLVHDLDTNRDTAVKTDGAGVYLTSFLTPGETYQVTVSAKGFKTSVLNPFALSVGQTATANVVMQPGLVTEGVTVTATDSLLDAQNADIGTLIDNKTITEMPLPQRSVFGLAPLAAGVNNQGFGDGNQGYGPSTYESSTDFSVNGAEGETTNVNIDGMSALANVLGTNGVGLIPTLDSIQEFKLVTSAYDASYGHSSATMSVALKAGTTQFHGAAWEYVRQTFLDANTYENNAQTPVTPQSSLSQNTFGGELDGPVFIPRIYKGSDKTFFMFSYERAKRNSPNFAYADIPDPQWLTGDFSNLMNLNGQQIPIFDPDTANAVNGYTRSQFPGNQVPTSRLNPIALKILSYYPKANYFNVPGAQPYEQFYAYNTPATETDPHYTFRIDEQVNSRDHVFFEFQHQSTTFTRSEGVPGIGASGDLPETSNSYGYGADWVHAFSSTLATDVHTNYLRYVYTDAVAINEGFDLTTLGLPAGLQSELGGPRQFPIISPSGYLGLGGGYYLNVSNTYNATPNVTWVLRKHTLRFGTDIIYSQYSPYTNSTGGITLGSDSTPTQEYYNATGSSTPSDSSGNSIASLLLGDINTGSTVNTGSSVDVTFAPLFSYHYFAPWAQDDWKVTPRLTMNLGFRWDFQVPPTERHNRISNGFDTTAVSPLNSQINRADYSGTLVGGLTFAGVNGGSRAPYSLDLTDLQPRLGFAYQLNPTTVLRGGYGRYYTNAGIYSLPGSPGYSYTADVVNSLNGGETYLPNVLGNPFPNGIAPASGSSLGLDTNAGLGVFYYPQNYKIFHSDQFSLGLEQKVGRSGVAALNYVGSRAVQQGNYDENENLRVYASCDYTRGGDQSICQKQVPNPFQGLADVNASLSTPASVQTYQLAVPYPQFTSVSNYGTTAPGARPHGMYNSMQLTYRAHTRDVDINASETWSKLMDTGGFIDSTYLIPARHIDGSDLTHRVTVSTVLQLPIGRGERFLGNMNRAADLAVGGWRLGTIYTFHTGTPQSIGLIPIGPARMKGHQETGPQIVTSDLNPCVEQWQFSNSTTGAGSWALTPGSQLLGCTLAEAGWQQQTGYQPNTAQGVTDQVRTPGYYGFDTNLSKTFALVGRLKFQLRLEAYNVLNNPVYDESYSTNTSNGEFGTINKVNSGQGNLPRQMQIAGRLTW